MKYEEPIMEVIILNNADIQATLVSGGSVNQNNAPGTDGPWQD